MNDSLTLLLPSVSIGVPAPESSIGQSPPAALSQPVSFFLEIFRQHFPATSGLPLQGRLSGEIPSEDGHGNFRLNGEPNEVPTLLFFSPDGQLPPSVPLSSIEPDKPLPIFPQPAILRDLPDGESRIDAATVPQEKFPVGADLLQGMNLGGSAMKSDASSMKPQGPVESILIPQHQNQMEAVRSPITVAREEPLVPEFHQSRPPQATPSGDLNKPVPYLMRDRQEPVLQSDSIQGYRLGLQIGSGKENPPSGKEGFLQEGIRPLVTEQTQSASHTSSSPLPPQNLSPGTTGFRQTVLNSADEIFLAVPHNDRPSESGVMKPEAIKEIGESGVRGGGSESSQGNGVQNGLSGFSQSQSGHPQQSFSASLQTTGSRGGQETGPEFPVPTLNRLQMDVQFSETQRVQIDVGVQHRQVFAGLVTDQAALRHLAMQFVPQLEEQMTNLDMELGYFSARARDEQEKGSNRQSDVIGQEVASGEPSRVIFKPQGVEVPARPGAMETGMHFVA